MTVALYKQAGDPLQRCWDCNKAAAKTAPKPAAKPAISPVLPGKGLDALPKGCIVSSAVDPEAVRAAGHIPAGDLAYADPQGEVAASGDKKLLEEPKRARAVPSAARGQLLIGEEEFQEYEPTGARFDVGDFARLNKQDLTISYQAWTMMGLAAGDFVVLGHSPKSGAVSLRIVDKSTPGALKVGKDVGGKNQSRALKIAAEGFRKRFGLQSCKFVVERAASGVFILRPVAASSKKAA